MVPEQSLDDLCIAATEGNAAAERALFEALRVRLLAIAKRRVQGDAVEDVVQEALQVVHRRLGTRSETGGVLPWSLLILRHTIGNHYQERKRAPETVEVGMLSDRLPGGEPADEQWLHREAAERMARAIEELSASHPRCGRLFRALLEGLAGGGGVQAVSTRAMSLTLAEDPTLSRTAYYVALHRCRGHLRDILARLALGRKQS